MKLNLSRQLCILLLGVTSLGSLYSQNAPLPVIPGRDLLPLYDHLRKDNPWQDKWLFEKPTTFPAEINLTPPEGIHAIYLKGPLYKGTETRIFAWYGVPAHKAGEKIPGIVLVHGGAGTAFANWVEMWNKRGYAAIAMDTTGSIPDTLQPGGKLSHRHAWAGPKGWGGFAQSQEPTTDQWPYHAVAAVIIANSFLRDLPDVDTHRIGITGISWGGYLTCIAAGVDNRYRFAMPVYGTGFIALTECGWVSEASPSLITSWIQQWDAANFVKRAKMPMLWVSGSSDIFYPLPGLQRTYRFARGDRSLTIRVKMPHGYEPGWEPEEAFAFADSQVKGATPLPKIKKQGETQDQAWIEVSSTTPITSVKFNYSTTSTWPCKDRPWSTVDVPVAAGAKRIETKVPKDATVYFFNVIDQRNLMVSSEHVEKVLP